MLADGSLASYESGTRSPGIDVAKKVSRQDIKDISAATLCRSMTGWTVNDPVIPISGR